MERCIQLAKNGIGSTYPNPLVGSVIVHNHKIIGEGWHQQAGLPHAEVNAINSVKNKELLQEATIYVSLEPCSHFGKTPPCANLIIEHKIPKIVIGCVDSFSEVAGRGIEKLKNAGCEVIVGVLEPECLSLNKRFFTYHNKKRPYIFLKWAQSNDGYIAPENNTKITWISNSFSKQLVHKLRSEEQGILVGTNTALTDNPKLNTREWFGKSPTRIVIDKSLKITNSYSLLDGSVKTIVFTEKEKKSNFNVVYEKIDFTKAIAQQICNVLYQHQLQSVIIEGGTKTLQTFIDENLWDEAFVFEGNNSFKKGIKAPILPESTLHSTKKNSTDNLKIFSND
ncbi:bifunctional diaminohydroxyphosphoribosylaminopyrimidine deaminase/5-amino-6-(5-phosphoribosylamino)uracil reductase RibD [Pseudofulvibacter geojedonensis]|uniref:Riboflavin biosynthesis protein RibD n=1 Tax=Pseudofulvibacter geojedonensis TaxID=1123758 RepID=A0ABW3HZW6_9FLAO